MNSVLEYAKLYAGLGWKVFPVNKRKRLAVKWTIECTTDIKKIEDWYRKNPHLGVGIACGPSNLFVLDIDLKKDKDGNIKHNGFIELEQLEEQHGSLPDTLISQTGGGGRHYFFTPQKVELKIVQEKSPQQLMFVAILAMWLLHLVYMKLVMNIVGRMMNQTKLSLLLYPIGFLKEQEVMVRLPKIFHLRG